MAKRKSRLDRSTVSVKLGVCAAALGGTAATATDAHGQIVTFSPNLPVPATLAGVYINLLTGATGTSAASVPGWDFNPYAATGLTQLGFYWAPAPAGGVAATTTGPYLDLPVGTVIGPASTYTRSIVGTAGSPFHTTGTHVLGFAFLNEATSQTNYGFLTMTNTTGTPNGFPTVINTWSFESSGAPIVVPEPATVGLTCAAMIVGARGLRRWRKDKQAAVAVAA